MHAFIEGRVQGVGFRYFVQRTGNEMGLTGWVRNRRDGRVEVVAEGARADLDQLSGQLRQGPPSAHVTDLDVDWKEATGEFRQFGVRRTI